MVTKAAKKPAKPRAGPKKSGRTKKPKRISKKTSKAKKPSVKRATKAK